MLSRCVAIVLIGAFGLASASAQQKPATATPPRPGAMGVEEATELTQGWAFLSQGLIAEAQSKAAAALSAHPRSIAALNLAIEVEIARAGSEAALSQYERWLGQRTMEEPGVVRRLAEGVLREEVAQPQNSSARLEALRALASDGDARAMASLSRGEANGDRPETRILASAGDPKAVGALIDSLARGTGNPVATLEALGNSGNQKAVDPLVASLKDRNPEVRAAAVTSLGKLGQRYDLIDRIKPTLSDPTAYVRVKAAAALYSLGDNSGLGILQELATSDAPVSRLMAVQGMASKPDAQWLEQVRQLTSASEPEVRVGAATLLVPHDPELARRVLEGAMNDPNPAIREMAGETTIELSANDLRALRYLLKSTRPLERVKAGGRILALVR